MAILYAILERHAISTSEQIPLFLPTPGCPIYCLSDLGSFIFLLGSLFVCVVSSQFTMIVNGFFGMVLIPRMIKSSATCLV